jgi:hypothetical protein
VTFQTGTDTGGTSMKGSSVFNPFRNLVLNLQATGPAAVIGVLFICITTVGIFGNGALADKALTFLGICAGGLVFTYAAANR